ncbi:YHS domain-containing protein [Methyloceanibacter sp.]|uniref:YHS domain-containing protein n=1 Tax=Methyloceanibacter sp. TaxID=1965321 RepID=UPI002D3BC273|nr:YHS domain-containing protein [Methyloceanibacter sp.]HZP08288.1 YHS domain-containing protein [Methyloceanibacter sp.]
MKVIDPVCGAQVDAEKAAAREDNGDQTYFFCSAQCQRLFKASPERYIGRGQQSGVAFGSASESDQGNRDA